MDRVDCKERHEVVAAESSSVDVGDEFDAAFESIVFAETIFQAKGFEQVSWNSLKRNERQNFTKLFLTGV